VTPRVLALVAPPSPIWYFARGAGFVTLVLLSASVCLGILVSMRRRSRTWPLFVTDGLHRYVTLVFFAFLVFHVVTVLIDPFTKFNVTEVLIPFLSPYRRLWMGLGIVAAEISLALAAAGWLRNVVGYRVFRMLHFGTYAILPLALLHGIATGTDTRTGWGLVVYAACALAPGAIFVARVLENPVRWRAVRAPALGAAAFGAIALVAWATSGPLEPGWVKASGTPSALLTPAPTPSAATPAVLAIAQPFTDTVQGTITASTDDAITANGNATGAIPISWRLNAKAGDDGPVTGTLDITKDGNLVCEASLTGLTRRGFVATCNPPNAQGQVMFILQIAQSGQSAVIGQLQVSAPE